MQEDKKIPGITPRFFIALWIPADPCYTSDIGDISMRKILFTLLCVLLLASCALDNSVKTGMVSFTADRSRGVSAYIEYPALLDKTWTLQAIKTDNGATTGEGTYDAVLLPDFAQARSGDRVADLGAGTGIISILMASRQGKARSACTVTAAFMPQYR